MSALASIVILVVFFKFLHRALGKIGRSSFTATYTVNGRGQRASTYIDSRGYERFSNSGILVSRYVATKKLGRKLEPKEVVHHVDGNKLNNAWNNLEVYASWEEHTAVHQNNLLVHGAWHKPAN